MAEHALDRTAEAGAARRPWTAPRVEELPRLTELTLQTGEAIDGGVGVGSGSTVF